ncbi:MAG TPA: phosphate ABC transporter ATP-binding protein [Anaerolineae bacterium]|nr:phosphate ABC transporter ATP-binding protein [Anaerolineae bacterium]
MTGENDSRASEPILRTKDLGRAVNGTRLVEGVTIAIERRQVVAIVGPSGAGKSSLLRLLNRLDEPTSGTVYLDGHDYRELEPQALRRRVGMVMQTANLFPGTVERNIRFGPRQRGEELAEADVEELLARVELAGYARRDVSRLSGGEAQRVSIARTLANSPEVLLLDEPTSSLDAQTEREVEDLMCEIVHGQGLTCLIVTHDIAQAHRLASHALLLQDGRLVGFGPVEEVLDA